MSDKNLKDKVEETLFFYPIREILCAIGGNNKMLEPEDEQKQNEKNTTYNTTDDSQQY